MDLESRTMRMLLQSMPKKGYFAVFILFFAFWIGSLIVGAAVGIKFWYSSPWSSTWECYTPQTRFNTDNCTGVDLVNTLDSWSGEVNHLSVLNQMLLLEGSIVSNSDVAFTTTGNWTVIAYGRNSANESWTKLYSKQSTRGRALTCPARNAEGTAVCDTVDVFFIPFLDYSSYRIVVSLGQVPSASALGDVNMRFSYVERNYTLFELWFRSVFLFFSFIVVIIVAHRLRNFAWRDWMVEQKWTAVLLIAVMGYDNPFYGLRILVSGWFPTFLNAVLLVTFISLLLLYWLVMLDGILKESSERSHFFYLWKFLLVGLIWVAALVVLVWSGLHELDDPQYSTVQDVPGFVFFYAVMVALVIIYTLWLFYVLVRGCADVKQKSYLGSRVKFFAAFTLIVIIITAVALVFDLLAPANASIDITSTQLLAFLSLFNFYIWVNAILYLPSGKALLEGPKVRPEYGMQRLEEGDEAESLGDTNVRVTLPPDGAVDSEEE